MEELVRLAQEVNKKRGKVSVPAGYRAIYKQQGDLGGSMDSLAESLNPDADAPDDLMDIGLDEEIEAPKKAKKKDKSRGRLDDFIFPEAYFHLLAVGETPSIKGTPTDDKIRIGGQTVLVKDGAITFAVP